MDYRINKQELLDELSGWNRFLKRKVRLIACGGTALTLLGLKESTKDIDFLVPEVEEYNYLIVSLKELGYKAASGVGFSRGGKFSFDLFPGKRVHTTELLDFPLSADKHIVLEEFTYVYLGILNFYDLIITKLFRGSQVDFEDCGVLFNNKKDEIDIEVLKSRFEETASYEIAQEKVMKNLDSFLKTIKLK